MNKTDIEVTMTRRRRWITIIALASSLPPWRILCLRLYPHEFRDDAVAWRGNGVP